MHGELKPFSDVALEGVHGNRADASGLGAPALGRPLELMNQGLVWLADDLRVGIDPLVPASTVEAGLERTYLGKKGGGVLDRDDAVEIKRLALQAIESLSRILLVEAVGGEGERSVALRRAVGTLIGEVDVGVLVRVYEAFPDLDDLR